MGKLLSLLVITLNLFYTNGLVANKDVTPLCFMSSYIIHIKSNVNNLMLHCQSKDDDLGPVTRNAGEEFDIRFCINVWRTTLFYCHFNWQSKHQMFDVFALKKKKVPEYCYARSFGKLDCYWWVKDDGFYVPLSNEHTPNNWVKRYDWE
ncbi:hypothetical protein QVD17_00722 [Tagetes erecta]|uniref:S-protein homolog n=1 Tax=Tagetes erecta TaxID=13708 RepID=A0AAD8LAR5_TARER|nr:hypothetical protein QVD17_00722 [Tagetes erecta]